MQPFSIPLAYRSRRWRTVRFELGRDEIGSTDEVETRLADDIIEMFSIIGLPQPQPLPVLALEHQIAQKLHACTSINPKTGRNERAHDLVDLQILDQEETINMATVAAVARRLFTARRGHAWPPTVVAYERWDTIYAEAATAYMSSATSTPPSTGQTPSSQTPLKRRIAKARNRAGGGRSALRAVGAAFLTKSRSTRAGRAAVSTARPGASVV